MSRVVDIEEVLKKHKDYQYFTGYPEYDEGVEAGVLYMVENLENLPIITDTAEVKAVIHAEWVKDKSGLYTCSNCHKVCPYDAQGDVIEYWECNYCPKCGAIMNAKK